MSKTFTPAEVAQYKTEEKGIYLIIDGGVYDVTSKPPLPISLLTCFSGTYRF
jgi:predicted heme/steroid binding protein